MPRGIIPDPTTVDNGPDIDGFKAAMDRLRLGTGTPIAFLIPQAPVWPPGTPIDAVTHQPYDPGVQPVSGGGYTSVTKTCGVIFKDASRLRPGADSRFEPGGEFSGIDAIFDLDDDDYVDVRQAARVQVFSLTMKIVEWKPDGLTALDRWLIYCQEL